MESNLKHVYTHRDGNGLCDISDEVERIYGFGCCPVSLGPVCGLWVDVRFPHWQEAMEYARELISAAKAGASQYKTAVR